MIKNSAAVILLGLAVAGCRRGQATPPGFQGVVELDERVVAFEVPGRVRSVEVKRGDPVRVGDALASLDDTMQRLTLDVRSGEVDVARADLKLLEAGSRREDIAQVAAQLHAAQAAEETARKAFARVAQLFEAGALPQAERDRASAELARAEGERQSLEARLSALRKGARREELARAAARTEAASRQVSFEQERLARFTVKALVSGTVVDVHVEPGELAATGTPVATIADAAHPYVDVFIPQQGLDGVRVGGDATVRVDATAQPFPGKIEWISPKTEFTPRFLFSERERPNLVVRVRVRVDDPQQRLHAGVPAFVEVARP